MLIGPQAILPSLVRSPTVLATAITFFRRFFLSNSILDFTPRRMAVAAAFLAAKVEDQKVEVSSNSFLFINRWRA
jgi:cyclin H